MKKLRAFLLTSSALLCFSLVSCNHNDGSSTPSDTSTYTLMIYMCGSTLESDYGYASMDLSEILSVNVPDNIKIIIRAGGTSEWKHYTDVLNSNYIQTFRVLNHQLVEDESQRTAYTSGRTMGDAEELKYFTSYCKSNYWSSKNALILWNHGGGMQGVCADTHNGENNADFLTNSEVDEGLEIFTGNNKLDWIGYDACLMSVQDIADKNSKHAKYMISSQENEPAIGWSYNQWLPTLCNTPSGSTETLLKKITDTYVSTGEYYYVTDTTMSVLDLSKMSDYSTSWNKFSTKVKSDIIGSSDQKTNWNTFTNKINEDGKCIKFGAETIYCWTNKTTNPAEYENADTRTFFYFNLYDVGKAISALKDSYSSTLSAELNNLESNLNSLVTYKKCGSEYTSSNTPSGLSFFMPKEEDMVYYYKLASRPSDLFWTNPAAQKSWYETTETSYSTWQSMCSEYGSWNTKTAPTT